MGETPHPIRGVSFHIYSQCGLCYKETILVQINQLYIATTISYICQVLYIS